MKLSILMCSTNTRVNNFLQAIYQQINEQLVESVEVITIIDNKTQTIWEKRNNLISMAKGEYIVFVDDDDKISDDYISSLLVWIESWKDVVCFDAAISINWADYVPVKYSMYYNNANSNKVYYRKPNHLMCWKKDIATKIKYEDISYGEDTNRANAMLENISSEYLIDKCLYYYDYNDNTSESLQFKQ